MTIEALRASQVLDDPRVAEYRDLADAELVRRRGLFVAEGRLVVRRALEDGRYRVRSLLVNEAARRALDDVLRGVGDEVPILVAETAAFRTITGFNIHRGCLALVERPPTAALDAVLRGAGRLVVLEGVTDADNVGSVFRAAAAFGFTGIVVSPTCCDPFYRKAIRTSMGAVLRVPFARAADADWPGAIDRIRAAGFTVVALTPREPSQTLSELAARPRPARLALLVGTEGAGLSEEAEAAADLRVRIPTSGDVDSLNLAVATGIALYALDVDRKSATTEDARWPPG
jgi:tRNA G18 (ribose-2'-O)-methylase SpoU